MPFYDFADEVSVPATFTTVAGGAGAVSINSNHLRIDNGGTAAGDYAALVYKTAIDTSKLSVFVVDLKMEGNTGTWVPSIVGLHDSSGEPGAMTAANRDAALRIWHEYQMSSGPGGGAFDRVLAKIKNSAAGQYWWNASTGAWTNTFGAGNFSHHEVFEDCYYRYVIVLDGTTTPIRARMLIYGHTVTGAAVMGWRVHIDTDWVDFNTGTTEIDPVDNDLWLVLGDLTSSDTRADRVIFDIRYCVIGEVDSLNHIAFTNFSDNPLDTFPFDYDIQQLVNPFPSDWSLWIPRQDPDNRALIAASGSQDWVKDPHVHFDGTTYWMVYQIRTTSDADSDVFVVSLGTDIVTPSVGTPTEIVTTAAGEDKCEFPWLTKYGGTWYLFYDVENDDGTWEIKYRTSTNSDPTTGWSAATTVLSESGVVGQFDEDGVAQPFLIWHSGTFTAGTWYLLFAGYDASANKWQGGLAKSTTGITGAYTKVQATEFFPRGTFTTLANGAQADTDRVIVVDDTTGAAAGMMISAGADAREVNEIISVDSGTQLTLAVNQGLANNEAVKVLDEPSFAPRAAKLIGSRWVIYGTGFKDSRGGHEYVTVQIAAADETVIEDAAFRDLRAGDPFRAAVPVVNMPGIANENIGFAWAELTPVQIAATADRRSVLLL